MQPRAVNELPHVAPTPAAKTITYSYDAASRRRLMVESEGGRFTYGYLDDGLIRHLENPQNQRTTWSYDAAGQALVQRLANGTRASYAYDDAGRLLRLANVKSDGTTLSSFRDTWDAAGNRTSRIEADGVRVTWSYDATYQLTRERRGGANSYDITYTYDASSNRRVKLEDGIRTTCTCDAANQLAKFQDNTGVTTLTWDASGNQRTEVLPTGATTTNVWDFENRLARVHMPNGVRNTFAYNGDGARVRIEDSSGTRKNVWDGQRLLVETDGSDVAQTVYTQLAKSYGDLVTQRRSGATACFHFDPLGSADRLTDSSEGITDSYVYQAFGETIATAGSTVNPHRFVGREGYYRLADLQQIAAGARIISPALGRWSSADPLGLVDRANAYLYASNRPLVLVDPAGQMALTLSMRDRAVPACSGYWREISMFLPSFVPYVYHVFQRLLIVIERYCCEWRNPPPAFGWFVPARCVAGRLCEVCSLEFFEYLGLLTPGQVGLADNHDLRNGFPAPALCTLNSKWIIMVHSDVRAFYSGHPAGADGISVQQHVATFLAKYNPNNLTGWCSAPPGGILILGHETMRRGKKTGPEPPDFWGGPVASGGYAYTVELDCCAGKFKSAGRTWGPDETPPPRPEIPS